MTSGVHDSQLALAPTRPTVWREDDAGHSMRSIVYFVATFVFYWWHRWRHEVPILWRWLHQLHHSPQRIEVITSFYKHPLEIAVNSVLSTAIVFVLL